MARRKRPQEPENHERWMVSYADFITLLFAFFVVMYAISSVNEGKYRTLSHSLMAAFDTPARTIEPIQVGELARTREQVPLAIEEVPRNMQLPERMLRREDMPWEHGGEDPLQAALQSMADQILSQMRPMIEADLITVRRTELWLEVELNASVLFPSASNQLSPQAHDILTELAEILAPFPNPIRVEGFTDALPIHTRQYASNWELAASRAARVVRLFAELGVEPSRMAATAFGEHRPVADNDTADGRRQNRRVALVVLAGHDSRYLMDIERERSTVRLAEPLTGAAP